jgi:hypothetical protein
VTPRNLALASLVALLALSIVAGPSSASPLDRASASTQRGGGGAASSAPKLTASPNPVAAWSQYSLSGCGYVTDKQVTIVINNGTFFSAGLDGGGCLLPVSWYASGPGSYRIEAYQKLKGRKQTLMASTMLTAF